MGGDGDDFIDGGAAGDDIDAGAGNDIVHGGSATDRINGGAGNDVIYSDSGGDLIDAGDGNDTVYVNNGTAVDTVDCGPGPDVLHINPSGMRGGYSNAALPARGPPAQLRADPRDPADRRPGRGHQGHDARPRRHRAAGTDRNDNLLGSFGADTLVGLGGNDIIWANRKPTAAAAASTASTRAPATTSSTAPRAAARPTSTAATATTTCRAAARPPPTTSSGGAGADTIRLTGHGFNEVDAGSGDDIVYAYNKERVAHRLRSGQRPREDRLQPHACAPAGARR